MSQTLTGASLNAVHFRLHHMSQNSELRAAYVQAMLATIRAGDRNPEVISLVADALWTDGSVQQALDLYEMIPEDETGRDRLMQATQARDWCKANVLIVLEVPFKDLDTPVSWGIAI